jgi:phenylacetate-CoA ligase
MTEIGPLGFECLENPGGIHLNEAECIAEVIDPQTLKAVPDGQPGELVITNLGRIACPVIRYRTGDQVRLSRDRCKCGRYFARMPGGIIGRIDDMLHVRGNNVFPAAIEAVIRRFPEVAEFRVEAYDEGALTQVRIELEPAPGAAANGNYTDLASRISSAIQDALSFRAQVLTVSPGSLPRFEMKARRFVRRKEGRGTRDKGQER